MFLINGITREITSDAPKEDFLFGVTSDEKANIKYFKGPRYTKNSVDLASASIRINYINGGAETDQYIVTDLEADEEYITFSWTFHRNVTKYKGAVQFIVCAVKCDADGSITNEWNTTSAKGTVQQGIEVDGSEYEEETADAIESILLAAQNRINAMVVDDTLSQAGVAADAAATGAAIESLTKELEEDISQLSEEKINKPTAGNELAGQALLTNGNGTTYWGEVQTGSSNTNVLSVEPSEDDIPKVFFTGTAPTTKGEGELPLIMKYHSKTKSFKSYVTLKVQGDTSASHPKKNFNLKMFKDSARTEKDKHIFMDWNKTNKYCLKANWIDITQARNVVNGRLWGQVVKSRADYENYPADYKDSANCGAVNGFPIKVYLNGVYQGRYTWNIRKDESMFNMDDSLGTHSALIADGTSTVTAWRDLPIVDGSLTDWTDELNDTVPEIVKTSFQNAYSFVKDSTDEDFKANIEQYFYLSSLIDYYIFIYVILMYGGLAKSQTMLTYDGEKYLANIYDMDTTWALKWDGSGFYDTLTPCPDGYENTAGTNLLYERLVTLFPEKIKARYSELRDGALSNANIINEFEKFMDIMPQELVKEDYAETTAEGAFTEIPSKDTNNLQKLREIIVSRLAYCDEQIGLTTVSYSITNNLTNVVNDNTVTTIERNGSYIANLTITGELAEFSITMRGKDITDSVYDNGVIEIFDVTGDIVITAKAVEKLIPTTSISLSNYSLSFTAMRPQTITAIVIPSDTTDTLVWTSSNEEVATVENGVVTPISNGSCIITATAGKISMGCQVTVKEETLYPLVNGSNTSTTGIVVMEVTNGNHVKIENTSASNVTGSFFNYLNVTSVEGKLGTVESVNYQEKVFSLKAGDEVVFTISGDNLPPVASWGWRQANTNTPIGELGKNNESKTFTLTTTLTADYDVGSMFLYGNLAANTTYEFSVSLRVNGVKYI